MNWKNILKEDNWKPKRKLGSEKPRRKLPVKEVGGERQWGMEEDKPLPDDNELDNLAEETREDIMDMVMDRIGQMSKKELINLLVKTKGKLEEVKV